MTTFRWFLRRTFPVMVLTVLLMVGWGLITSPSQTGQPVSGEQGASVWGAKLTSQNTSTDSWDD